MNTTSAWVYRNCYGPGETVPSNLRYETVVFQVNIETDSITTPVSVKKAVIEALDQEVVDVVAKDICSGRRLTSRELGRDVFTIMGNEEKYIVLGNCEIMGKSSRSCSTYQGSYTIIYDSEETSSVRQVINAGLEEIQSNIDDGEILLNLNQYLKSNSFDIAVTRTDYAGPMEADFPTPSPSRLHSLVIVGTQDGTNYATDHQVLSPVGYVLVALLVLLGTLCCLTIYCLCRPCCRKARDANQRGCNRSSKTQRENDVEQQLEQSSQDLETSRTTDESSTDRGVEVSDHEFTSDAEDLAPNHEEPIYSISKMCDGDAATNTKGEGRTWRTSRRLRSPSSDGVNNGLEVDENGALISGTRTFSDRESSKRKKKSRRKILRCSCDKRSENVPLALETKEELPFDQEIDDAATSVMEHVNEVIFGPKSEEEDVKFVKAVGDAAVTIGDLKYLLKQNRRKQKKSVRAVANREEGTLYI